MKWYSLAESPLKKIERLNFFKFVCVCLWLFPFDFEANVLFHNELCRFFHHDGRTVLFFASFHFECLVSWKLNNLPRRRCEYSIDGGLSRFSGKEIFSLFIRFYFWKSCLSFDFADIVDPTSDIISKSSMSQLIIMISSIILYNSLLFVGLNVKVAINNKKTSTAQYTPREKEKTILI